MEVFILIITLCSVYKFVHWLFVEKELFLNIMEITCDVRSHLLQKIVMLPGMLALYFIEVPEIQMMKLEVDVRKWVIIFFLLCLAEGDGLEN